MPPEVARVQFSKYSGAGNDFAIVRSDDLSGIEPSALARLLCPRETGLGVDGMILVMAGSEADRVAARFFNPDGSEFSTCGNGTRCVARFALQGRSRAGAAVAVDTAAGTVHAEVSEETVALEYEMEMWVDRQVEVPLDGTGHQAWLVHVGTPHLILPVEALPEGEIEPLAAPIRHDPALGPEGANVDFVVRSDPSTVDIRTYERGVEGETLACGSGAMATALALYEAGLSGPDLLLRTRSGDPLRITLLDTAGGGSAVRRVRLSGPARHVLDGAFPARVP